MNSPPDPTVTRSEPVRILRLPEVIARTGVQRSFIYREMAAKPPRFPRNVKIGRASGWNSAAIDAWVAARLASEPL